MSLLKSYDEMTPDQQLAWKMGYDAAWRDYPTDDDVEAAAKELPRITSSNGAAFGASERRAFARRMLEAVKREDR